MRSAGFLWLLLLLPFISFAQENIFVPLKNNIQTEKQLLTGIEKRFAEDLAQLKGAHKKDLAEIYKYRLEMIRNRFETNEVLTHNESHTYLNAILEQVIKTNSLENTSNLRLAFSRNWWANASSMGEGTLLFNIGLFQRLGSEAQAAFVICHELAHFYLDHGNQKIHKHVSTFKSEDFQKKIKEIKKAEYRQNRMADELMTGLTFTFRRHSREDEAAADSMALELMKNTGYDLNEALTCLALLDSADQEKFRAPLQLEKIFNHENYPFKAHWLKSSSIRFTVEKSAENQQLADSLKTHPDCAVRITALQAEVEKENLSAKKKFLVSADKFFHLQKQFDYEVVHFLFEKENVSYCLYLVLKMLAENPGDHYLNTMAGRCLNELYRRQKTHELGKVTGLPGPDVPEEYNQLLKLIQNLRLQELGGITYHFLLDRASQFENNPDFMKEFITSKSHFLK